MLIFLLQAQCAQPAGGSAHQRSGHPGEGVANRSLGRRSEPAQAECFWGRKIGNSQSDGIAANHSRELRVQLGFEQIAVARRRAFRQFIR